jgi:hypothetical protein
MLHHGTGLPETHEAIFDVKNIKNIQELSAHIAREQLRLSYLLDIRDCLSKTAHVEITAKEISL